MAEGTGRKKARGRLAVVAVVAAIVLGFAVNTFVVNGATRAAAPRDGGELIDTNIVMANARVQGEGPPVVLIHGFSAAIDWWDPIAPALAKSRRVIQIDLLGHGGTAAPVSGYAIERQAALVGAVLDKLGVDRVSVIGHSMGGEVATALLEARPDRIERLILIDSPPIAAATFDLEMRAYLSPVLGQVLSHFRSDDALRNGLAQGFAPGFEIPERFFDDVRQLTYTAFRSAHEESVAYRTAKPTYERIAAAKAVPPLLAIFGAADSIVPPATAKMFERVPGGKVVMLAGVGHSPMVETPAKTLELIEGFLPTGR